MAPRQPPSETQPGQDLADRLENTIDRLAAEVRVIRDAIDELRTDIVHAIRNRLQGDAWGPPQITSQPADTPVRSAQSAPPSSHSVPEADEGEGVEERIEYCCARPVLLWRGDPAMPSIECRTCGYIVAAEGELLIYRGDDGESENAEATDGSEEPVDSQRELF